MKTLRRKTLGRPENPATDPNRTERAEERPVGKDRPNTESDRQRKPHSAKMRPSQKGTRRRCRIAKGIYRDRHGLAATVKVNGVQRERRFERETPVMTMRAWQDEARASLRTLPKAAKNTLAYDVPPYLERIRDRLTSFRDRRRALKQWLEKFSHVRTLSLELHIGELNAQLHEWRKTVSGATCNHRRDAVMNLVRELYGRRAAAGLGDLVIFPKPPPKPRWVERAHVADVLDRLEPRTKLRARLHLLHWTGMRPSQMSRLTPDHFRLDHEMPHVFVPRGKRGHSAVIPLLEEGVAAATEFMALNAYGAWRTEGANRALAKAAHEARRKPFTTYQIRHSFAAALRQTGADVADIQKLYGHTNPQTTEIYAPAAMTKHREAIERVRAAEKANRQAAEVLLTTSKTGN